MLNRRRLLSSLGLLGMVAAVPVACAARSSGRARQQVLGAGHAASILQIVAHQDDDVQFMNPDLAVALAAGVPTTTVYLTAGEAMGAFDHSRSRTQFASDRQDAARAAYGQMLGVAGAWNRQAVTLPGGQVAELATPPGVDHVRLWFLNLPDGDDTAAVPDIAGVPRGMALSALLLGQRSDVPTIVPDTGPVTASYRHTKQSLLAALTGFLDEYQPTVLRAQDPMFAEQRWRGATDVGGDHPDHIAAGRWADLALQQYLAAKPASPPPTASQAPRPQPSRLSVVNYVGYGMTGLAPNLSAPQIKAKTATFQAYYAHDANLRRFADAYAPYQHRRYHRWTPGGLRALPTGTGVTVFGVADQQVVQWTCTDVAKAWSGPFPLGGTGVRALDAVTQLDGRIRLFALQVDAMAGVSGIVTSVQDSPGGGFGPWSDPQNPLPTAGGAVSAAILHGDALGRPSAVATADGQVHLFVRGADSMVYIRTLIADGRTWLPWGRLEGRFVLDGISAVVGTDGLAQVYATAMAEPADRRQPAAARLFRWVQLAVGAAPAPDAWFPAYQSAGAPLAVLDQDGTPRVLYQLPDTAGTGMLSSDPDGTWGPARQLAATGGSGPITALAAPAVAGARLHVAVGTQSFGIGVFQQEIDASFPATWQDLGGCWPGPPALAADLSGRVVIAGLGLDGRLAVACQPRPGPGIAYSEFRSVGS